MAGPRAPSSIRSLSQAGLTNPDLVGAGVAHVYGMVFLGSALGIVLAVVFLGLLRARR